jgi:cysteine desulfurase / selenocysteine lyase
MTLDVAALRREFPTLAREVGGHRLVYLDSAASSQTPEVVLAEMERYYRTFRSNVHRGVYTLAEEATDAYEGARTALARLLNADARGVVFTKNATEACNLLAYGWARRHLGPGDAVLSTVMEHHANMVPFLHAAQACGFELRHVPITEDGRLDLEAARALVADGRVRLAAFIHVSNTLGTINDVVELSDIVRAANPDAIVHVDGSQAVPHLPVDLEALGVDSYALTGHKMFGPTGIGALVARPALLEDMEPFLTGGEMIRDVTLTGVTWNDIPHRFEAGTPMIAEAVGLAAAIGFLEGLGGDGGDSGAASGVAAVREHEVSLGGLFLEALDDVEGVEVLGPRDMAIRGGAISFTVDGVHPHDVGAVLSSRGVCVRVGHHCCKPLMRELGVSSTVRASLHVHNDVDDLEPLLDGLAAARRLYAR